ncbi:hypothetical protein [Flagellimonas onchidii]|uniref:hypothetical protein n=1 Tax=Flagellimonas onchidii TaxID=2562684 RepID=UPI0010A6A77A|nr:hypothetical protein [Allomuricauda onchidii]
MEHLINFLGKVIYKIELITDDFIQSKILKNDTTKIAFLLFVVLLISVMVIVPNRFISMENKPYFIAGYVGVGFILLIFVAAYYSVQRIKKNALYGFKFKRLLFNSVDYKELMLDSDSALNLKLLIRNKKPKDKIDFRLPNKNKTAANYKLLFTLFHLIIENGIDQYIGRRKKDFFELLYESFLMNGNPINKGTLESSFSNWKANIHSEKGEDDILRIKKILSIK